MQSKTAHIAPVADFSVLPDQYANNWHIVSRVYGDLQSAWIRAIAGDDFETLPRAEYQALAAEFSRQNPTPAFWVTGKWPENASHYLGQDEENSAIKLIEEANEGPNFVFLPWRK